MQDSLYAFVKYRGHNIAVEYLESGGCEVAVYQNGTCYYHKVWPEQFAETALQDGKTAVDKLLEEWGRMKCNGRNGSIFPTEMRQSNSKLCYAIPVELQPTD